MLLAPYVIVYLLLYFFIQVKIKSNNQQNSEYYDLISSASLFFCLFITFFLFAPFPALFRQPPPLPPKIS